MKNTMNFSKRFAGGLLALATVLTAGTLFTQQPANAWGWRDRVIHHEMMANRFGNFGNSYYGGGYGYGAPMASPYFYHHHHYRGW